MCSVGRLIFVISVTHACKCDFRVFHNMLWYHRKRTKRKKKKVGDSLSKSCCRRSFLLHIFRRMLSMISWRSIDQFRKKKSYQKLAHCYYCYQYWFSGQCIVFCNVCVRSQGYDIAGKRCRFVAYCTSFIEFVLLFFAHFMYTDFVFCTIVHTTSHLKLSRFIIAFYKHLWIYIYIFITC